MGRGTERILSSEDRSQRREYIRGWGIGKGHGEEEEVKRFSRNPLMKTQIFAEMASPEREPHTPRYAGVAAPYLRDWTRRGIDYNRDEGYWARPGP